MARDIRAKGVSDEMSIYTVLDGIISGPMASMGIQYRHETFDDPPEKYAVFSVISDVPGSFFAGENHRTDYRVQIDLVFPRGDRAGLYAAFQVLEAALRAGGARSQGNYAMADDPEDGRPYIRKDYLITLWGE
jgi:hypothetical protein